MDKEFMEGEINTPEEQEINSLILERASDTSDKLTELECKKLGIDCWVPDIEEKDSTFKLSKEAQEIFDVYYDEQCNELYNILNLQLKVINNLDIQK